MGEIFGALGQIGAAAMTSSAIKSATDAQIKALKEQQQFVFANLDPAVINAQSTAADIQRANAQLALQQQIDPNLVSQRYAGEAGSLAATQALNDPNSQANQVARAATADALATQSTSQQAKQALIDAALGDIKAGATLPPDVQAQLVQSGLEQSGMVTQHASGQGIGGQQLRTILGTAGINLQMQRQQQAAALSSQAQNLESSRQNILQGLFPNLTSQQLNTLQGNTYATGSSQSLAPSAGLTGQDVASIWLARVGATNQLAQSAAGVAAQGTMGQANQWSQALGGATKSVGSAIPLNTFTGWLSGPTADQTRASNASLGIGAV